MMERVYVSTRRNAIPAWFGFALFGTGLVFSGVVALVVALTSIVLPYDEIFLGLTRDQIANINPRLLSFMAHDRSSLAGAQFSVGLMYTLLAVFGVRQGQVWARRVFLLSGGVGFVTFFLFIGYGYFDPLHALGTLLLFVFFLLGVLGDFTPSPTPPTHLRDHERWMQRLLLLLGMGITVGGATIALLGATTVFVPQDLAYMNTTAAALSAANSRLIPVIAHDRAAFGGGLIANGPGIVGIAAWGFRRGSRWIWWTLLISGIPGYLCTIGTHFAIGYLDVTHLAPALASALMYIVALGVSVRFLCGRLKN
jgi:hypothetical protein